MQLAAHAKSSTLYGRSYGLKSKFLIWLDFGLIGYYYFLYNYGATLWLKNYAVEVF